MAEYAEAYIWLCWSSSSSLTALVEGPNLAERIHRCTSYGHVGASVYTVQAFFPLASLSDVDSSRIKQGASLHPRDPSVPREVLGSGRL